MRWGAERSDFVTSVSRYTRHRMIAGWWKGDPAKIRVLPNTVGKEFQPGPKPEALIERYGLAGKKILLTVSRISIFDQFKGRDLVIQALLTHLLVETKYNSRTQGSARLRWNRNVLRVSVRHSLRIQCGLISAGGTCRPRAVRSTLPTAICASGTRLALCDQTRNSISIS